MALGGEIGQARGEDNAGGDGGGRHYCRVRRGDSLTWCMVWYNMVQYGTIIYIIW